MGRAQKFHMTRGGGVHTVPGKVPGWINEMSGKVLSHHRTKAEAVSAGRSYARHLHVEHTIHTSKGLIGTKNSYGSDPYPPKDSR